MTIKSNNKISSSSNENNVGDSFPEIKTKDKGQNFNPLIYIQNNSENSININESPINSAKSGFGGIGFNTGVQNFNIGYNQSSPFIKNPQLDLKTINLKSISLFKLSKNIFPEIDTNDKGDASIEGI